MRGATFEGSAQVQRAVGIRSSDWRLHGLRRTDVVGAALARRANARFPLHDANGASSHAHIRDLYAYLSR